MLQSPGLGTCERTNARSQSPSHAEEARLNGTTAQPRPRRRSRRATADRPTGAHGHMGEGRTAATGRRTSYGSRPVHAVCVKVRPSSRTDDAPTIETSVGSCSSRRGYWRVLTVRQLLGWLRAHLRRDQAQPAGAHGRRIRQHVEHTLTLVVPPAAHGGARTHGGTRTHTHAHAHAPLSRDVQGFAHALDEEGLRPDRRSVRLLQRRLSWREPCAEYSAGSPHASS